MITKRKLSLLVLILLMVNIYLYSADIRIVNSTDTNFSSTIKYDKIISVGDTFTLEIWVNSNNINVNGVSAYLTYDTNYLLLLDTDDTNIIKTDTNIREIRTIYGDIFENREPIKGKINYSALTINDSYAGDIKIAQMIFLAYQATNAAFILFDYDQNYNRESALVTYDNCTSIISSDSSDPGIIKIIPPPPQIQWLKAIPSSQSAIVQWQATTIEDSDYYKIYYDTKYITNVNNAIAYETTIKCSKGETEIIITGLKNNQLYYFAVVVVDILGKYNATPYKVASTIPRDSTPPADITNIQAIAGVKSAAVLWAATTAADADYYKIYYSTFEITYTTQATLAGTVPVSTNDTLYIVSNLTAGQKYYFYVTCVDKSGNEDTEPSYFDTCIVLSGADTTPPPDITGLQAYSLLNSVKLIWQPASASDSYFYKIYYDTKNIINVLSPGVILAGTIPCATNETSYIVDNLANFQLYYFAVTCVDTSFNEDTYPSVVVSCSPGVTTKIETGYNENNEFEYKQLLLKPIENIINIEEPEIKQKISIKYPIDILANEYDTFILTEKKNIQMNIIGKRVGKVFDIKLASGQTGFTKNINYSFYIPANITSVPLSNLVIMYSQSGYHYDWNIIDNQQITLENNYIKISFSIDHLTFFGVFDTSPPTTLNAFTVYPNPYVPASNSEKGRPFVQGNYATGIVFDNITATSKIWIYSITGELITYSPNANGANRFHWDAKNQNGEDVASGIYIYVVKDNAGNVITGKLAIVR